jgi:hypothetical protein
MAIDDYDNELDRNHKNVCENPAIVTGNQGY